MKITVVGLGSGALSSISFGAYDSLKKARKLFLRTQNHPIVDILRAEDIQFESFDFLYEKEASFEAVYLKIKDTLIEQAEDIGEVVYAVPGHPRVAESSVELLLGDKRVSSGEIEVSLVSSSSFLDDMFIFLNFDPTKRGFVLLDALDFDVESLGGQKDFVFAQVHNRNVASELKLRLMDRWNDETPVILFKRAGIEDQEEKKEILLYEIDQTGFEFDHLTSLFVPYHEDRIKYQGIFQLVETIAHLRGNNGCPWDKKQTSLSLIPNLREEVEELISALEAEDIDNIVEELGDVLMILVMEARLGEEEELFTMSEVTDRIVKKLIFRHPHVFGENVVNTIEEANFIWEQQKNKEKKHKSIENN